MTGTTRFVCTDPDAGDFEFADIDVLELYRPMICGEGREVSSSVSHRTPVGHLRG
jgi:hypothetical protein